MSATTFRFDEFEIDVARWQLRRGPRQIELQRRPFEVLLYLLRNRDRVVSHQELVNEVWNARALSISSVPTAIRSVRRALLDDCDRPRFVQTIHGRGYRFVASVRETLASSSDKTDSEHPFVGRSSELETLHCALERSMKGSSQLVLVSGETGIGKTRLLDEFQKRLSGATGRAVVGRCSEVDGAPEFWPWAQILRASLMDPSLAGVPFDTEELKSLLARLLPELHELQPPGEIKPLLHGDRARFALYSAVARLIRQLCQNQNDPLAILFDDVHRADVSTLLMIKFVALDLADAPLLFVLSYRDADLQTDPTRRDLIADLARARTAQSLPIGGLSHEAVRALLGTLQSSAVTADLVALLSERTGGNPFFLGQLIHALPETTDPEHLTSSCRSLLPEGVRGVILRHVRILPASTQAYLALAAVLGREFDIHVMAEITGAPIEHVTCDLEPAFRARLIASNPAEPWQLRFTHMLVRDVIYDEIPAFRQRSLHQRTAIALENLHGETAGPNSVTICHHLIRAGTPECADRAVTHAVAASDWATAQLAYEMAPFHLRQAISALEFADPKNSQRLARLLLALGEAEMRAGERNGAVATLNEAIRLARVSEAWELFARATLAISPGFLSFELGVVDHKLIALLEEAISRSPHSNLALTARLLARLALALTSPGSESIRAQLAAKALDLADRAGDEATLTYALGAKHAVLWGPENADERLAISTRIVRSALGTGDFEMALVYRQLHLSDLLELGDMNAAATEIEAFLALSEELKLPRTSWHRSVFPAMRALLAGRLEEAEQLAYAVLERGNPLGDVNATLSFGALLSTIRLEQGRFQEVIPTIEEYRRRYVSLDLPWRAALAIAFTQQRRFEQARCEFDSLARNDFADIPRNLFFLQVLTFLASPCAALRDSARARILYELLQPYRDRMAVVGYSAICLGSVARPLGLLAATLGAWDRAETHFRQALVANERIGARLWLAHTMHAYARALARRNSPNDRRRARQLTEHALSEALRGGWLNLASNLRNLREQLDSTSPKEFDLAA